MLKYKLMDPYFKINVHYASDRHYVLLLLLESRSPQSLTVDFFNKMRVISVLLTCYGLLPCDFFLAYQ